MKTQKKWVKPLIITLLIVFATSCFSLLIINLIGKYKTKNTETSPKASNSADVLNFDLAYEYYIKSLGVGEEALRNKELYAAEIAKYPSATTCTIGTYEGLQIFESIVKEEEMIDNYYEFCRGKKIKLTDNIDCHGDSIILGNVTYDACFGGDFWGIFDGQGYTISNLEYEQTEDDLNMCGLFLCNRGTIKNLKVKKVKFIMHSGRGNDVWHGPIAGINDEGTIESCIVEDISIESARNYKNYYVGGISGLNYGYIQNCLVEGTFKLSEISGNNNGVTMSYFSTMADSASVRARYCIFNADIEKDEDSDNEHLIRPGLFDNDSISEDLKTYKNVEDAYDGLPSDTKNGPEGSAWYKFSWGGNNYIKLRAFVDWATVDFAKSSTKNQGEIKINNIVVGDVGYLYIPNDKEKLVYNQNPYNCFAKITEEDAKGYISDNIVDFADFGYVEAVPNIGYKAKWSCSVATTRMEESIPLGASGELSWEYDATYYIRYTVEFELVPFTLNFCNYETSDVEETCTININTEINVLYTQPSAVGVSSWCMEFTFTDHYGGSQIVEYVLNEPCPKYFTGKTIVNIGAPTDYGGRIKVLDIYRDEGYVSESTIMTITIESLEKFFGVEFK